MNVADSTSLVVGIHTSNGDFMSNLVLPATRGSASDRADVALSQAEIGRLVEAVVCSRVEATLGAIARRHRGRVDRARTARTRCWSSRPSWRDSCRTIQRSWQGDQRSVASQPYWLRRSMCGAESAARGHRAAARTMAIGPLVAVHGATTKTTDVDERETSQVQR